MPTVQAGGIPMDIYEFATGFVRTQFSPSIRGGQ